MDRDTIVHEPLPFPYAHYADTFIGFHEALGTEITFCSCQLPAVENHLEICRIAEEAQKRREEIPWYVTPYADYPRDLFRAVPFLRIPPSRVLLRFMKFRDGLCHRCNQRIPYGYYG